MRSHQAGHEEDAEELLSCELGRSCANVGIGNKGLSNKSLTPGVNKGLCSCLQWNTFREQTVTEWQTHHDLSHPAAEGCVLSFSAPLDAHTHFSESTATQLQLWTSAHRDETSRGSVTHGGAWLVFLELNVIQPWWLAGCCVPVSHLTVQPPGFMSPHRWKYCLTSSCLSSSTSGFTLETTHRVG